MLVIAKCIFICFFFPRVKKYLTINYDLKLYRVDVHISISQKLSLLLILFFAIETIPNILYVLHYLCYFPLIKFKSTYLPFTNNV